jgi:hypothetical protein
MTYDTFFCCRSDDFDGNHARVLKKRNRYLFEKKVYSEICYRYIAKFSFHKQFFHEHETIHPIKIKLEKYGCISLKPFLNRCIVFRRIIDRDHLQFFFQNL